MKCGYKYCKLGGNVEKSEAVKLGSRYWHKECCLENETKKEIRETYYRKFKSKEPIVAVNKAISKYIHEQNYEAGYVLYCLKHKAEVLNSLYGLSYSLSYKKNHTDYKKWVAKQTKIVYNKPVNDFFEEDFKKVKTKDDKKWGDYF